MFLKMTSYVRDDKSQSAPASDEQLVSADDQLLAQLGYRPELKREFSYFTVFGQSFGSMGIAPAIAESIAFSLGSAGAVGMVWTFLIGCLLLIPVALSLGELSSSMPTSGGLYYVRDLVVLICCFSSNLINSGLPVSHTRITELLCVGSRSFFLTPFSILTLTRIDLSRGYMNTLGYISIYASTIYAATLILGAALTIATDGGFLATATHNYGIFSATVLITFCMTCVSTAALHKLNFAYILVQFAMLFILIVTFVLATPSKLRNTPSFVFLEFHNTGYWANNGWAFMMSFLTPVWVVSGFETAATIAEEASNAAKAVPFAMVSSLVTATLTGWGIIITIAFCMGTDIDAILLTPLGQPLAQIAYNALGKNGSVTMLILLWFSSVCNCSILMVAASREIFAFARDHGLPGSFYLRVLSSYAIPVHALGFVAVGALLEGLLMLVNAIAINSIFNLSIMGLYFAYCMPLILRLITGKFVPGVWYMGDRLSKISAWYSIIWMFFLFILLLFPSYEQPTIDQMNYAIVVLGSVIIFCVAYYWFPIIGGRTFFTGPVRTIDELVNSDTDDRRYELAPANGVQHQYSNSQNSIKILK